MRNKVVEGVEVVDAGVKGQMIGKKDGLVFMLQDVIPGDTVNVLVKRRKNKYYLARPLEITSLSPNRSEPFCEHFADCGGCKWQNIEYTEQVRLKSKAVSDAFERTGLLGDGISLPPISAGNTKFYRNKLDFSASPARWLTKEEVRTEDEISPEPALGFHVQGRFDKVLNVNNCYLQPEPSNTIRLALREFALNCGLTFWDAVKHQGLIRSLIIRTTLLNEVMVILVAGEDEEEAIKACLEQIKHRVPSVTSLYYVVNKKPNDSIHDLTPHLYAGKPVIRERAGHIQFDLGPLSFYQTNSEQAEVLYRKVEELAALKGNEHVWDLYCGVGTIGMYLGRNARKITGIEVVEEAVELARQNAAMNQLEHMEFYAGEAEQCLSDAAFEAEKPDLIVVDPPRAGMHKKVVRFLADCGVPRIIYVSCNPSTQARDIELLSDTYKIQALQPVDMFPHTHHVENIAILEKK